VEKLRDNFYTIPNSLLDYFIPLVGSDGIVLYNIYTRLQNKELGYAFPSIRHLKSVTGFGMDRIHNANNRLQKYKLVTIERHWGKSNHYYVHDPVISEKVLKELKKLGRKPLIKQGVPDTGTPKDKPLPDKASGEGISKADTPKDKPGQVYPKQVQGVPDTGTPVYPKQVHNNTNLKKTNLKNDHNNNITVSYIPEGAEKKADEVVVDKRDFKKNSEKEEEADALADSIALTMGQEQATDGVRKLARELLAKYEGAYIAEKVNILAQEMASGKVKNPVGWLRAACDSDYEDTHIPPENLGAGSKLRELEREIAGLKSSLEAAIDKPVRDFQVVEGRGMPTTQRGMKEWTISDLRSQLGMRMTALRGMGGKCQDVKLTEKEKAILFGFNCLKGYEWDPDIPRARNILSSIGKHYQKFENYGDLIGFSEEEYRKATAKDRPAGDTKRGNE